MRQVNWTSKERADVPDMQAVQSFVQAEFRRQLRAFIGLDFPFILRGFQVEPETPASSRVVVKLDNSPLGDPFFKHSLAYGPENLGAVLDSGQLIGGEDSAQNLEGPAQLLLDFAPQAIGTYVVEMRYVSTLGSLENRAFWDEGTNTEFVNSVPTRILPSWELQLSAGGASGDEWIPLAEVNWDGASIDAGDITDLRFLILEGVAANAGFDFASQFVAAPDFDRASDRGTYGVGMISPMAAINALQRQVMDLKGQDEDGNFNWYGRTYRPAGGLEAIWFKQTKSLRTVETCTFTIGDEGDYGDFNGEFGLNLCLFHIQAQSLTIPKRIKIILKNRRSATTGERVHTINTPVVTSGKQIEIIGEMGQGIGDNPDPVFDKNPLLLDHTTNLGQHLIRFDIPIGAVGINMVKTAGRTSLKMRNIVMERVSETHDASYVNVEGPVQLDNVSMRGRIGGGAYVLNCYSEGTHIRNSFLEGVVNIGGHDSEAIISTVGGRIEHTTFMRTVIRLRSAFDLSTLSAFNAYRFVAQKLTFDTCSIVGRGSDPGGDFDFGTDGPHAFGMIDARGSTGITWKNCTLIHSSDEDGVRFGKIATSDSPLGGGLYNFEDCAFERYADNTHLSGAGVGGVLGTGNHVLLTHIDPPATHFELIQEITFQRCRFLGLATLFFGSSTTSPDASDIFMNDVSMLKIVDNKFIAHTNPVLPGVNHFIRLEAQLTNVNVWIEGNFMGEQFNDLESTVALRVSGCAQLYINRNRITPFRENNFVTNYDVAVTGIQVENVINWTFCDNDVEGWLNDSSPLDHTCMVIGGIANMGHVSRNTFRQNGGSNIIAGAGSLSLAHRFDGNYFEGLAAGRFFAAIDFAPAALTDGNHFVGNAWGYGGVLQDAIRLGNGLNFTLTNNWFRDGVARHSTLGGVATPNGIGYGVFHSASVTNLFSSYL